MNRKVYILQSILALRALAVIIVMLLTSATAWADDSGYIGKNVIWRLTDEDGDNTKETLTISGSGDMDMAYFNEDVPWLSCRSNIKTVVIESGVTSIVYGAFSYCNNLTSVTIPASVTYIDDMAFRDCGNLTSITIPSGVETIGEMAFWECTGLTSVYIPSSVTIIDDFAFGSCSNLRTVIVQRYDANDASPITTLGWGVFRDCHEDLKIYVPADGLDVYKADNDWSGDAGKIKALQYTTGVDYLTWSDSDKKLIPAKTPEGTDIYILNGTERELGTKGQTTWYVAKGTLDYTDRLTFQGDTHLILADDCAMTIGTETDPITVIAIECKGSITIYGQSKGDHKGKLTATSASSAIYTYDGDITINGGQVTATGIIGIQDPDTGLAPLSYGIQAFKGNITINGGQVTAKGSYNGIISHDESQNSRVTINGGQVTAIGGNRDGIGIKAFSVNGSPTLTLGWTDASDYIMASSYSVCTSNDDDGKVHIAAGKRFVAYDPVGEGETELAASGIIGNASSTSALAIDPDPLAGKTLRPLDGYYMAVPAGSIVNGKTGADGKTPKPDFTIDGIPHYIFKTGDNVTFTLEDRGQDGVKVDGLPIDLAVTDRVPTIEFQMRTDDINVTAQFYIENTGVDYLDWDDNQKKLVEKNTKNLTPAPKVWLLDGSEEWLGTEGQTTWYIAQGTISYSKSISFHGDAHLILADNCKMIVDTEQNPIAYAIETKDCNLTIYGQSTGDDMGSLTAVSDIISIYIISDNINTVTTINGGIVTAIGTKYCVSVSGYSSHMIVINGGIVTASGNYSCFDINKNKPNADASLVINGGQVTAKSDGKCIWAYSYTGNGSVTINGGQVTAIDGNYGIRAESLKGSAMLSLGWINADDFIYAKNYYVSGDEEIAKIVAGKYFYDGSKVYGSATADYVFGAEGNATLDDIANKKLIPALPIDASQSYFMRTFDGNWKPIGGGKTFLPDGYDLAKGVVTLKEVAGAPDGLPVIVGPEDDKQPSAQYFVVGASGDEAKTIQDDYDNVVKDMSERFVITDGTKTLTEILKGMEGVDASEAVILILTNGKFTTVDFSADDLGKKTKAGLLLFVLSKWEYMHIKPSNTAATTSGNATTRTIGIGDGEATGIREVTLRQAQGPSDDAWHDLQGRKISKPTKKGIYIYNGKKVLK